MNATLDNPSAADDALRAKRSHETRAKMSEGHRRRWADPEDRAKLSEGQRRRWADPEDRAKLSEGQRRRWADPVVRAKMSEGHRRRWIRLEPIYRRIIDDMIREPHATYQVIADRYGVSRQRIAQIARRHGIRRYRPRT